MNNKKEEFIKKSKAKFGEKFTYEKVNYKNNKTKVCLICTCKDKNGKEHGEFLITPNNHLSGNGGCKKCKCENISSLHNKGTEEFINESRKIHGDKYDYSKVEYINNSTKVCIICPEHGEFWQTPMAHLNGCGCIDCAGVKKSNTVSFIEKAKKIHGDKYDYSKVEYVNNRTKVIIKCNKCGKEFLQTPHGHLLGRGCETCSYRDRGINLFDENVSFIEKAKKIHGDKYDYSLLKKEKYITIICPKHGCFIQNRMDHLQGCGCPKCGNVLSKGEDEIKDFIMKKNIDFIQRDRKTIFPNEIDILLPKYNVGIEFDGLFWHSDVYKKNDYHLEKTNNCKEKGIRLIHIFEDEWQDKKEIIKSMINNIIGKTSEKIYARNCSLKSLSYGESKLFLNENHLQGNCKSSINYGLEYNGKIVAVMSFGKTRQQKKYNKNYENTWEIYRFCNKLNTTVVGGASKLLKHFIKEHQPHKIITYADKRWSDGKLYKKLGFTHTHDSKPNYFYVINSKRKNRFNFRKNKLVKEGFDKNKTEREIMQERGIHRIYDCGTMVFEMNL